MSPGGQLESTPPEQVHIRPGPALGSKDIAVMATVPLLMTLLGAGCAVSRQPPVTLQAIPLAPSQHVTPPSPAPSQASESVPVPGPEPSRPPLPDDALSPYADLGSWLESAGVGTMRLVGSSGLTWELTGPARRTLQITAGSRVANVNGVQLWLGMAPWTEGSSLRVHRLDLTKTIDPLLTLRMPRIEPGACIVIDPGHGGPDPGTRSVHGNSYEKDYTLDLALRLASLLGSSGCRVVLTRSEDIGLTLAERVALADSVQAQLFVSLHFNSAGIMRNQSGVETYCLTPAGLPSTLVRDEQEDSGIEYPNNRYDDMNILYATRLHGAMLRVEGLEDRGVRRARFLGVLRTQQRPAVLLECGYLSNPDEAARIDDPEYRQQLARALSVVFTSTESPSDRPDDLGSGSTHLPL